MPCVGRPSTSLSGENIKNGKEVVLKNRSVSLTNQDQSQVFQKLRLMVSPS